MTPNQARGTRDHMSYQSTLRPRSVREETRTVRWV
jgi:hypothetical protein